MMTTRCFRTFALLFAMAATLVPVAGLGSPGGATPAPAQPSVQERWRYVDEGAGSFLPVTTTEELIVVAAYPPESVWLSAVRALEARTGAERWAIEPALLPGEVSLALGDEVAIYLSGPVRADAGRAFAVAIEAATGQERWRREFAADGAGPVGGAGGRVFFRLTGAEADEVVALDAASGVPVWRFAHKGYVANPSLDAASGLLYATVGDPATLLTDDHVHGLVVLDAASGTERWRLTGEPGADLVTFAAGLLVVGPSPDAEEVRLLRLDPTTGEPGWSADLTGAVDDPIAWRATAAGDGVFAVGRGEEDGLVVALEATTGERRWSALVPAAAALDPPVVAGEVAVLRPAGDFGIPGEQLLALDRATGAEVWEVEIAGLDSVAPRVDELYVTAVSPETEPTLRSLSPGDGSERWALAVPGFSQLGFVAATGDAVYLAGIDEAGAMLLAVGRR